MSYLSFDIYKNSTEDVQEKNHRTQPTNEKKRKSKHTMTDSTQATNNPVSILHKYIAGRYRPVRVADGPITARCRFMKNASREMKSKTRKKSLAASSHKATCQKPGLGYTEPCRYQDCLIYCATSLAVLLSSIL